MALDTGATDTLLRPEVLDGLGYSPRDAGGLTTVTTALGVEPGYWLTVNRLRALGHEFNAFRVNAHDLPEDCGLDGLLGLNFLRHFNYEVRSKEGVIRLELA
ncbi:MAG: retroviral-like aspartic protease family protein [Candidatus Riflebacteria bacterium]|nr:retroviral-like aspartic protease family protein [Candidatus Riflebacteria bacterium]